MRRIETADTGIVKEIKGNTVYVVLSLYGKERMEDKLFNKKRDERGLWAYYEGNLQVGDKVKIELLSSITLGRIFMLTMMPLIVFLTGYLIGDIWHEGYLWAGILFASYFIFLFFYSKKVDKDIIARVVDKIDE